MGSDPATKLTSSTANWVRMNIYQLQHLPEPDRTWTSDCVELDEDLVMKLVSECLIERVDRRGNGERRYYKTKRNAYNAVQTYLQKDPDADRLLPCTDDTCPGNGFSNIGNDKLRCTDCGETHHKDDINR